MTALKDLEKRLEEATGPDRELDATIFNALPYAPDVAAYKEDSCVKLDAWGFEPRFFDGWLIRRTDRIEDNYPERLDEFTSSLDAAVSLCERVLPEHDLDLDKTTTDEGVQWCCMVWNEGAVAHQGVSKSPALALCLATVRALIAKGGASD